jgi:twitching motility two-component system response regulator PilH
VSEKAMAVKKIMVVDDSPTQRYFLMDLLTKNGYNVVAVETGEEALAKVKQEAPNLIIMDVVMPGQNGFQTTRAITKDPETENIPVIMCTSKSQETDKIWGLRQGARDFMVKPVDPDELLKKISTFLAD